MERVYKALNKQVFTNGNYSLIPIRNEDRYNIMRWRNEQIFHLRQTDILTVEQQDTYFDEVVASLFNQKQPSQILFSFLKGEECIGYGGLVHINWEDRNAELSFIMSTELEKVAFKFLWSKFLEIIEIVAFEELAWHKIYTYAFDLRSHLYEVLEENGFKREAVLKNHCRIEGQYKDVVIHSLVNKHVRLRNAENRDVNMTYAWANNSVVRQYSLTQGEITFNIHRNWFDTKLSDAQCIYYIAEKQKHLIGSLRLDINTSGSGYISYLVDPKYHGNGYGSELLRRCVRIAKNNSKIKNIIGDVMIENYASIKAFENLGFTIIDNERGLIRFKLDVK
jgi:RimJ/RimL family protein N-acetyltransferase